MPGESYDGSTTRGGVKAVQSLGYVSAYHWAQSLDDVVQAVLEVGPVVAGTDWTEDMLDGDDAGLLHATGPVLGGHEYVIDGVSVTHRLLRIKNSWGRSWNSRGFGYLSFNDFASLLAANGDACLAVEIAK